MKTCGLPNINDNDVQPNIRSRYGKEKCNGDMQNAASCLESEENRTPQWLCYKLKLDGFEGCYSDLCYDCS